MKKKKSLFELLPGQRAVVKELKNDDDIRRRLLDIGLIENTEVECVGVSPFGDPSAFLIRGAVMALRSEESKKIIVY